MRLALITILSASLLTACNSWSGPQSGGNGGEPDPDPMGMDASPDMDAAMRREAGMPRGDDASTEGGADGGGDASPAVKALGDARAGHILCDQVSCGEGEPCCTTNASRVESACAAGCGATEASITCDGPEDCSAGQVCCHRFGATGLTTECIGAATNMQADASAPDAAAAAPLCTTLPGGQENRVACHTDQDCKGSSDTPLCRADGSRRDFLGYCVADTDKPSSPGHDDRGLVSCGDPDDGGTGETCSLDTDICCLSRANATAAACSPRKECGFSEVEIVCDGPEDCAKSQACCFTPKRSDADGGIEPPVSACAAECTAGAVKRCHLDADCGGAPGSCQRDAQSAWWGSCQT